MRVELDDRVATSFGRRATDWELKGVPVRVEVGPRDLAAGDVTVVRRDTGEKQPVPIGEVVARVAALTDTIQAEILARTAARRDERITDVATVDEAAEAAATGWARLPWDVLRGEGEKRLAQDGVTVRACSAPTAPCPTPTTSPASSPFVGRSY